MDEDLMIMGKLIYVIATVVDIKFVVNTVNQFMHDPRISHIDDLIQIFIDLKISITWSYIKADSKLKYEVRNLIPNSISFFMKYPISCENNSRIYVHERRL